VGLLADVRVLVGEHRPELLELRIALHPCAISLP
jgi:hypothetical protein